ncbi:hypothetical protein GAY31_19225 [Azospirillum brasilense]|nr:hypothetical protein [Azospirillum brasilense]
MSRISTAIALSLAAILPDPALAGDKTPKSFELRDDKGDRAGRAVPRGSDRRTYDLYDELGRRQGTITREGFFNDLVIRDELGNRRGRINRKHYISPALSR